MPRSRHARSLRSSTDVRGCLTGLVYDNVLSDGFSVRNRQVVFLQSLYVHLNCLTNVLLNFLASLASRNTTRQIWQIS